MRGLKGECGGQILNLVMCDACWSVVVIGWCMTCIVDKVRRRRGRGRKVWRSGNHLYGGVGRNEWGAGIEWGTKENIKTCERGRGDIRQIIPRFAQQLPVRTTS